MIGGFILVGFCMFILGIILTSCVWYRKEINAEIRNSKRFPEECRYVSLKEVCDFVAKYNTDDTEDKSLEELFIDFINTPENDRALTSYFENQNK